MTSYTEGSPDTESVINLLSAMLAACAFVTLMAEIAAKTMITCRGPDTEPNDKGLYEIVVQVRKDQRD